MSRLCRAATGVHTQVCAQQPKRAKHMIGNTLLGCAKLPVLTERQCAPVRLQLCGARSYIRMCRG